MHDFQAHSCNALGFGAGNLAFCRDDTAGVQDGNRFRRYIQTHDERLVEAANALAKHGASEMANGFRRLNTAPNP